MELTDSIIDAITKVANHRVHSKHSQLENYIDTSQTRYILEAAESVLAAIERHQEEKA